MSRSGRIVRPVLRFIASVLICSGIMMLVDAGLTVTWQEPVSAFIAARQQGALGDELDAAGGVLAPIRAATVDEKDVRKRIKRLAEAWRQHVDKGDAVGRIALPTLDRRYVVVQGTDLTTLRKGPGHYPKTPMPGEGGTIAVAGHRTTYGAPFRPIDKLKPGQQVIMEMPYGKLTYEVEKVQIVPADALWITDRVPGRERLVLSACHPLYSAAKRIVVFSTLVRSDPK
jgi:sortase A